MGLQFKFALLLVPIMLACNSMKNLEMQALAYEEAGMHQDALNSYHELYTRDTRRSEARIAMQRSAQSMLDKQLDEMNFRYLKSDHLGAISAFQEAEEHRERMAKLDLALKMPPRYAKIYTSARSAHSEGLFASAKAMVKNKQFEEAEDLLYQLTRFDPKHDQAHYLWKIAELEPMYLQARKAEELGLYRDAFRLYTKVAKRDIQYKDSFEKQQEMRSIASYTVAFTGLSNNLFNDATISRHSNKTESTFSSAIKNAILDLQDPLIRLVDRDNTEELLNEQRLALSDIFEEEEIEAGRMLGAKYVLTGKILKYNKVTNKRCDFQIELMETSTGEIHVSEIITFDRDDLDTSSDQAVEEQITSHIANEIAAQLGAFDQFAP